MARTALYRLFGTDGELLYVGITSQPLLARMGGHAKTQHWWNEAHRAEIIWYDSREEADRAETRAIRTEYPKHNKAKVWPGRGPRLSATPATEEGWGIALKYLRS